MDNYAKQQIMDEIRSKVDVCIPVPPIRWRIRCPFCGDTDKDPRHAHCYIKCSDDPNEPLLYNCFLANCGAKGKVDKYFLSKLGIKSKFEDQLADDKYNRIKSFKKADIEIMTGKPEMDSVQIKYIEKRLGKGFTEDDYDRFKIVWDISTLVQFISNERVRNTLPSNRDSISFLSEDKSMLLNRSFYDDGERWRKIKMFNLNTNSIYLIKTTLDLFTKDEIEVNIAEGVFDVLSIYRNFNNCQNSVFIAVLGPEYDVGVNFAIQKGIIGENVTVKIYIDDEIDKNILKKKLRRFKWLFGRILIYENILYKDVGTTTDKIKLLETRV